MRAYIPKERRSTLLRLLMEHGAMTAAELARATGWHRTTCLHHLDILMERGQIYRAPRPILLYSVHPPPPLRTLAEIYDSLSS